MPLEKIHAFAVKWFEKFRDISTKDIEITDDTSFADDCFNFDFKMDCGEDLKILFLGKDVFNDWQELDKVIDSIDDVKLLGSAIFSKWRYFNHWAGPGESITAAENRAWFLTALGRLEHITSKENEHAFILSGEAQKMKLSSNCLCFGPCPEPDDEIEQHLTITIDGRIFYSNYNWGDGEKYQKNDTRNFKINHDKAKFILRRIQEYFSNDHDVAFATDVGSWDMELTNEDGEVFKTHGSLCPLVEELDDLSEMIRDQLDMPNLFVFNGDYAEDRIEALNIKYHRLTRIKPNQVPDNATWEYVTWDYNESMEIDRKAETLKHTQIIGTGCKVTRLYEIEGGISNLLDGIYSDNFLEEVAGNAEDVVRNPLESKDYEIEIDFLYAGKKIITGSFDKNGLPDDFPELADTICEFIFFYGMGEILDSRVYGKKLRRQDEMIFCNVRFDNSGKTYCYLTEDESLNPGDAVVVPVGYEDKETVVEIESIEYYTAEDAPFPVNKIKRILRKYEENEE